MIGATSWAEPAARGPWRGILPGQTLNALCRRATVGVSGTGGAVDALA